MTASSAIRGQRWKRHVGRLAALLLLAGCAAPKPAPEAVSVPVPPKQQTPLASLQAYGVSPGIGTQCVPYARARSGIKIFGDAHTWWNTAEGQYARGNLPMVGSVLVLSKTKRLRRGHVGVVTAIVTEREIRLDHANWQPDAIITNMAVMDVSPANDWTQLRFWNKDARKWGAVYPASGFVYNMADIPSGGATTKVSSSSGNTTHGSPQQSTP
ncbi:MAG: CHAP domain-containing protein [Rhodospirillaceae bacterium]|nr:CHAP domain-containing protein [Rhodospirillaceae bacterium]